ncbi:hypothetical protein EON67_02730 [archaeon]|nr:MAG: hypothetical protein EON67_02730 [archaeon]
MASAGAGETPKSRCVYPPPSRLLRLMPRPAATAARAHLADVRSNTLHCRALRMTFDVWACVCSESVRVVVRIRPLSEKEKAEGRKAYVPQPLPDALAAPAARTRLQMQARV